MRISKVSISNYRGLNECELTISPFVCIIGENNAGKSTILLALSLFFSGTKLTQSDFYNSEVPIKITLFFEDVTEKDLCRVSFEHRERISDVIIEGKMTLVRRYETDGTSDLLCKKLMPKDERFDSTTIGELLKGKRGSQVQQSLESYLPEYKKYFEGVTTQTAAKESLSKIILDMPTGSCEEKEAPLPTGIPNSILKMLPEPILIPAVKDITDDVKTKESATFGKLIGVLLKLIEGADEVQKVIKSFIELNNLLNITKNEDGSIVDNRLFQVKEIENTMKGYLQENFPKVQLELVIPKPELKQVFSSAQIFLDDGVKDNVETKGDGLKRAVTFALLRSYVDIRRKHKSTEDLGLGSPDIPESPYIFLFEEPELYLHPSAQRILFDALERLSENHQVVVTTHSPMFFAPNTTGTFIKVIKKYPDTGKPYGHAICVDLLNDLPVKDSFQIICFENNSAAFFAEKVVLVEGDSDVCYFKHIAKVLNDGWDFDAINIPVVKINGKGNVKRYKMFFERFGIKVFTIVDLDALIEDFDKLDASVDSVRIRSELLVILDGIAESECIDGTPDSRKIKEILRRYTWVEKYSRFKVLAQEVAAGKRLCEDELNEIGLLFSHEVDIKRRELLGREDAGKVHRFNLLKSLRERNIFVLSKGALENYYPSGVTGEDKPTKALNACKIVNSRDKALENCPEIECEDGCMSEYDVIFNQIFS